MMLFNPAPTVRAATLVRQIEAFVHNTVVAYEKDPRLGGHGPSDDLVQELRDKARAAGLMTPHILADGSHLTQRETAAVLRASGHSPLGPVALNTMAPDEGNMFLIGKVANGAQKRQFLEPLVAGRARSAFLMTEPAEDGGAGSDPGMLRTTATPVGGGWTVNGRKAFITGFQGASVGIIMARTENAATMFLVGLPNPAIRIERVLDTIDASMPGGHSVITIDDLHVGPAAVIGEVDQGFQYAQVRLAPPRTMLVPARPSEKP
jgi:acyl-CoA dehydrogenase